MAPCPSGQHEYAGSVQSQLMVEAVVHPLRTDSVQVGQLWVHIEPSVRSHTLTTELGITVSE